MLDRMRNPESEVRIGVVGKYVELGDAYKSLSEALMHGGLAHNVRTVIEWIEAEELDSMETAAARLANVDGILVPGGFGKRGIQGMVYAIQHAREKKIPFFGICLGMQCATIEYARDVAGLKHADSTEFDPNAPDRVIYKLRELLGVDEMGGTMRLGAWPCVLQPDSFAARLTANLKSASVIDIATNSIASTKKLCWLRDSASPEKLLTELTWKLLKRRNIRGLWDVSSIRNLNPARLRRIRCSPHSSPLPTSTAQKVHARPLRKAERKPPQLPARKRKLTSPKKPVLSAKPNSMSSH